MSQIKNHLRPNKRLSCKYGLHICDSPNKQNPYYVREWDECYTEKEIQALVKDHWMIESIQFHNDVPVIRFANA